MRRLLITLYVIISVLFAVDITLWLSYSISLPGFYADRILLWVWIILTLVMLYTYWKMRVTKIYLGSLIVLIFLSMLPMMIPFLTILSVAIGERSCFFNVSSSIRVEHIISGPIVYNTIEVIEKKGVYETVIAYGELEYSKEFDSIWYNPSYTPYEFESHSFCDANSVELIRNPGSMKLNIQYDSMRVMHVLRQEKFEDYVGPDVDSIE